MQDSLENSGDQNSSGKIQRDGSKTFEDDPLKILPHEKKSGDSNKVLFRNAIQIHTKPEGYNSGRQYVIKARDEAECQKIVQELNRLSKIATDKFLAKSNFDKAQVSSAPTGLHKGEGLFWPWPEGQHVTSLRSRKLCGATTRPPPSLSAWRCS